MIGIAVKVPWVLTAKIIDPEGRYIILFVRVENQEVIIVGVYAPNRQQTEYWEEIFNYLQYNAKHGVIMLGEFNAALNVDLDRSSKTATSGIPATFLLYMKQFQLIVIWREVNPRKWNHTFLSKCHCTHSRIVSILATENVEIEKGFLAIGDRPHFIGSRPCNCNMD